MSTKIPASQRKLVITYLLSFSFSSPNHLAGFEPAKHTLLQELEADWSDAVLAACQHIVAFHQASRDPDAERVAALARAAQSADSSPQACRAFQEQMQALSELPGRAKENNRLHRKKGCRFCVAPCRYGYYSLISEPDFDSLQSALEAENTKLPQDQQPLQAIWTFTLNHISQTLDAGQWHVSAYHLGNLAYCLLMLSTAKSRFAFPEDVVKRFQEGNQQLIRRYQSQSRS
ncbi:MAG: hypothetical protein ISR58_05335 [Anaerolineales bacterium]|nr:hypothetical protein [Chloroflexota bacterium]MBL6980597.1 hypothetical protein [Anaerolineales bacterium]